MLGLTQLSNYLTLKGSFSAVSKKKFANKYALESSRRDLPRSTFVGPYSTPRRKYRSTQVIFLSKNPRSLTARRRCRWPSIRPRPSSRPRCRSGSRRTAPCGRGQPPAGNVSDPLNRSFGEPAKVEESRNMDNKRESKNGRRWTFGGRVKNYRNMGASSNNLAIENKRAI